MVIIVSSNCVYYNEMPKQMNMKYVFKRIFYLIFSLATPGQVRFM